jgi:hypothetical protein
MSKPQIQQSNQPSEFNHSQFTQAILIIDNANNNRDDIDYNALSAANDYLFQIIEQLKGESFHISANIAIQLFNNSKGVKNIEDKLALQYYASSSIVDNIIIQYNAIDSFNWNDNDNPQIVNNLFQTVHELFQSLLQFQYDNIFNIPSSSNNLSANRINLVNNLLQKLSNAAVYFIQQHTLAVAQNNIKTELLPTFGIFINSLVDKASQLNNNNHLDQSQTSILSNYICLCLDAFSSCMSNKETLDYDFSSLIPAMVQIIQSQLLRIMKGLPQTNNSSTQLQVYQLKLLLNCLDNSGFSVEQLHSYSESTNNNILQLLLQLLITNHSNYLLVFPTISRTLTQILSKSTHKDLSLVARSFDLMMHSFLQLHSLISSCLQHNQSLYLADLAQLFSAFFAHFYDLINASPSPSIPPFLALFLQLFAYSGPNSTDFIVAELCWDGLGLILCLPNAKSEAIFPISMQNQLIAATFQKITQISGQNDEEFQRSRDCMQEILLGYYNFNKSNCLTQFLSLFQKNGSNPAQFEALLCCFNAISADFVKESELIQQNQAFFCSIFERTVQLCNESKQSSNLNRSLLLSSAVDFIKNYSPAILIENQHSSAERVTALFSLILANLSISDTVGPLLQRLLAHYRPSDAIFRAVSAEGLISMLFSNEIFTAATPNNQFSIVKSATSLILSQFTRENAVKQLKFLTSPLISIVLTHFQALRKQIRAINTRNLAENTAMTANFGSSNPNLAVIIQILPLITTILHETRTFCTKHNMNFPINKEIILFLAGQSDSDANLYDVLREISTNSNNSAEFGTEYCNFAVETVELLDNTEISTQFANDLINIMLNLYKTTQNSSILIFFQRTIKIFGENRQFCMQFQETFCTLYRALWNHVRNDIKSHEESIVGWFSLLETALQRAKFIFYKNYYTALIHSVQLATFTAQSYSQHEQIELLLLSSVKSLLINAIEASANEQKAASDEENDEFGYLMCIEEAGGGLFKQLFENYMECIEHAHLHLYVQVIAFFVLLHDRSKQRFSLLNWLQQALCHSLNFPLADLLCNNYLEIVWEHRLTKDFWRFLSSIQSFHQNNSHSNNKTRWIRFNQTLAAVTQQMLNTNKNGSAPPNNSIGNIVTGNSKEEPICID